MAEHMAARILPGSAPGHSGQSSQTGGLSLLAENIPRQLRALTFSLGLLFFGGFVLNLMGPSQFHWNRSCSIAGALMDGVLLLTSIALFFVLAKPMPAERVVRLGLVYLVAASFAVSMAEAPMPYVGLVSLVAVFVVLFPLFVPTTLKLTVLATFAAATTGPVSALIHLALTGEYPQAEGLVARYFFTFFMGAVAIIPAKIMFHMGRQMGRARRLGSYELKRRIGRGGMGEVWQAAHRMLRRPAAVKLIRPEAMGAASQEKASQLMRRFEREAQATATLHSPHTIEVYDFGTTECGAFYYVMELLDGFDLETFVDKFGPMAPERVVSVLRQVCDSLQDAHLSGLIHRDIKPANIFLCRYGHRTDFVKVLDFGLVKSSPILQEDQTQLTVDGGLAGTPSYMAPEIAVGDGEFDVKIDIYALGCVAYWLLTGNLVFEADSSMKMVLKHIQNEPEPPSKRSELSIPEQLEELVMACLAKDPAERPQSAEEVAQRLEQIELDQPWNRARADQWWQMHSPSGASDEEVDATGPTESIMIHPNLATPE